MPKCHPCQLFVPAMLCIPLVAVAADLVIEAPSFAVGDKWEFSGTENGKPYPWSREIIEIMPDTRLRVKAVRNGKESIELYDRWMNFLVNERSDRVRVLVKYPLMKGSSWKYSVTFDNPNAATQGDGTVIGEEHLVLPIGGLDCLKVETSSTFGLSQLRVVHDTTVRWYCPEIKWIAKELYSVRTSSKSNPAENVARETDTTLVRFTPGR